MSLFIIPSQSIYYWQNYAKPLEKAFRKNIYCLLQLSVLLSPLLSVEVQTELDSCMTCSPSIRLSVCYEWWGPGNINKLKNIRLGTMPENVNILWEQFLCWPWGGGRGAMIENQQFCQSYPDSHFVDLGEGWGRVSTINDQQFCQSSLLQIHILSILGGGRRRGSMINNFVNPPQIHIL